jgi:hypothetical protein
MPDSQRALPPRTFSRLQRPAVTVADAADLALWAGTAGDVVVRPIVDGVLCVVVKKGPDVHVGVAGRPGGSSVKLGDLVVAMERIPHDYVLEGVLLGLDLQGRWLGSDSVGAVLSATVVATPVFFPTDVLVLDGDLSEKTAAERWELLRALVPEAGGHVVVPRQVVCPVDRVEDAVEHALAWQPSDGEGLRVVGAVVVRADSGYSHGGESPDVAALDLSLEKVFDESEHRQLESDLDKARASVKKDFSFGAGPGSETPGKRPADERPLFLHPEKKGVFGTSGTSGILAPDQGVFRKPRRKDVGENLDVGVPLVMVPTHQRRRPGVGGVDPWPAYPRKSYDESEHPRDDQGQWTDGGGGDEPDWEDDHVGLEDDPGGDTPMVNWGKQDLQDSSKKVDAASVLRDYAEPGDPPRVYQAWVDMSDLPDPEIAEDQQQAVGEELGDAWKEDYDRRSTFPPIKIAVDDDEVRILDGNHRVKMFGEWGFTHAPAWVLDYRAPVKKNVSGGGAGDGDSTQAPPAFAAHSFVVGRLKGGEWVEDRTFRRVNPYEAIFLRPFAKVRKPDRFPQVGADMGFNDSYDALVKVAKAGDVVAVDFDGTCTVDADGTENPKVRLLVQSLVDRSVPVVVFTARDAGEVREWLDEHKWPELAVTNVKSPDFKVMLDDRAVNFDPETLGDPDLVAHLSEFRAWWEKAEWSEADHPRDEAGKFATGPGGSPAEFGRMSQEEAGTEVDGPPGEHLYHTTSRENLEDVASGGLQPHGPSYRGEQDEWPDGKRSPRTYFATRPGGALKFSEPDHVLLRVPTEGSGARAEFRDADYYTGSHVPSDRVEVLQRDGSWRRLSESDEVAGARKIVESAGLKWNGVQDHPTRDDVKFAVLTDPETRSTGMVRLDRVTDESVAEKVREIRERFAVSEGGGRRERESGTTSADGTLLEKISDLAEAVKAVAERPVVVRAELPPAVVLPAPTRRPDRPRRVRKTVERDARGRISAIVEEVS